MTTIRIPISRVTPPRGAPLPLPTYATSGSAGMDLRADEGMAIPPGYSAMIPTGILVAIPPGYEGQIRPRSGKARIGIMVPNAPGTIDSDYRGEVKVLLFNNSGKVHDIVRGDRIAQLVIAPVIRAELEEVTSLDETERGAGGFGSTGR